MRYVSLIFAMTVLHSVIPLEAQKPTTKAGGEQPGPVLVLPFVSPPGPNFDWVGKGIQQNLIAELTPNLRGGVISPASAQSTDDHTTAIKAGRENRAAVVIFGSSQLLGRQIRLTGQLLDVSGGKVLGTLKATGPLDNLFRLEDILAGQALQALPGSMLNLRGLAAAQQTARPRIIQLPSDAPAPAPSAGGEYSLLYAPQPYQILEPPAPPYSPYSFSYPYRFYYPYYHLFSYGGGFRGDCFFPFGIGFGARFDGHWRGSARQHGRR